MPRCLYLAMVASLCFSGAGVAHAQQEDAMERVSQPEEAETRNCLPISHIRRIETVDNQTLVFHMRGKDKYVNHLPYRCSGLKRNSFIHETSLNSYCDLDIISVVDLRIGMRMGSCPLGKFEKVPGAEQLD